MTANFFVRENKNDLFPEDLLYPIKYTGKETDEKKVKEKIIAGFLKCKKTKRDPEFGEITVFCNTEKCDDESVTYVVSRKPFYTTTVNKPVVCLKKKCVVQEVDLQSSLQLFSSSPILKELFFSKKRTGNYIEYIFESGFADTSEFDFLYRFLNGESNETEKYLKVKSVCHSLYAFFRDTQPETKNLLENILTDDDYKNI